MSAPSLSACADGLLIAHLLEDLSGLPVLSKEKFITSCKTTEDRLQNLKYLFDISSSFGINTEFLSKGGKTSLTARNCQWLC